MKLYLVLRDMLKSITIRLRLLENDVRDFLNCEKLGIIFISFNDFQLV